MALDVATDDVSVFASDGEETDSAEDAAGFFGCYVDDEDDSEDSENDSTEDTTNSTAVALASSTTETAANEEEFAPRGRRGRR